MVFLKIQNVPIRTVFVHPVTYIDTRLMDVTLLILKVTTNFHSPLVSQYLTVFYS